ncbi:MAG TPA: hypothetical protein VLJ11_12530 [Bryobacteraceae bacterium]|nr:hypothetical protein [Bryobacteraceae bacterium]
MCPLILNKEGKDSQQTPEQVFNPERLHRILNRCHLADALLTSSADDTSPDSLALRILVKEDVPAMLETLSSVLRRHSV